ncbi:hypothetical protein L249_7179 [Ophiocordyceps polyrhachis-furcata BCC 54312]|uniref:Uncharacterized protein n=1 Tax=Ophiocordyceps polyrhachis-furcata BCC 54312 TaxID=1330021 RepID=A0A367LBP5_9HYPO|nr:hypothetical protein L249_7179 [Ophiocordyceps polyrhachis-furcata BCC 54312]
MGQVLELGVFVMILFPVVDLILVLVVAVVAWAGAHVGQGLALGKEGLPLGEGDDRVAIGVEHGHDIARHLLLTLARHVLVGRVHQTVGTLHLVDLPDTVGIDSESQVVM